LLEELIWTVVVGTEPGLDLLVVKGFEAVTESKYRPGEIEACSFTVPLRDLEILGR
jgi:hypothetical protein